MPQDPEYSTTLTYRPSPQGYVLVYGSEYHNPVQGTHDHEIPCAVCYVSTRPTVVMIPAKASCPPTWTREYYGYLMTAHKNHKRSTFECVDRDQESLLNSNNLSHDGALFYHVEADCASGAGLPCSYHQYNSHQELNCVVCTK